MQGYGTLLLEEAERIAASEHRSRQLAIISGVGTRHYYRKLGYRLDGHYMVCVLHPKDPLDVFFKSLCGSSLGIRRPDGPMDPTTESTSE